jgi:metallo-beta-lactamase family protein
LREDASVSDRPTLTFCGAAGTVTGSRHLVSFGRRQVLLDCGEFQGLKDLRERNWADFPFAAARIDAVVLSHAHIDHSGALPLLVKRGFRGPIYCTPGTADLLELLLRDAAHLQEEEADFRNRHNRTKHAPALPLYTTADAEAALRQVEPRDFSAAFTPADGATALFRRAGHIMGSATVELRFSAGGTLVFTGDLGRYGRPILRDPEPVPQADTLLIESTYGDRVHTGDPAADLERAVKDTAKKGGALVIPAFAVGRTQELLWMLRDLEDAKRVPVLPVYVDSPMAVDVTDLYVRHAKSGDDDIRPELAAMKRPLTTSQSKFARTVDESKAINSVRGPVIIISASGMATGGRVLHHLAQRLPEPTTTVLLVGYQADGTRGRALQDGAKTVTIMGQEVPVRAAVTTIHALSAHGDRDEMLRWLNGVTTPPRATYAVHGEDQAARAFVRAIAARPGWSAAVAQDRQVVTL